MTFSKFNLLNANPTKWSNILKQFVGNLPTNCLSVLDYFVGLSLKGLNTVKIILAKDAYNNIETLPALNSSKSTIIKTPERRH